MIKFYIIGQTIRYATPAIAADSLNYLECEFDFSGEGWEEASKWAHFRQGETVFDIAIEDDLIPAEKKLNLTIGEWEVYITGTVGESRLTTVPVILTVYESGLIDAPLHEIPLTVAEQIDAKASTALLLAQAVKDAADSGAFKGEDGKDGKDGKDGHGIEIGDYYGTLTELQNNAPKDDKLYGVGNDPVVFYGWSDNQKSWIYVGSVQGIPGEDGADGKDGAQGEPGVPGRNGVIFYPSVSDSGFLSWTNDGGLSNPQTVNIMGPKGATGATGADGKGPYEYAQEGGYTGTEATFITALTQFPYHHTRHEEGGADPLNITLGMLPSISVHYTAAIPTAGWTGSGPYTNRVTVTGILASDSPDIDLVASDNFTTAKNEIEAWGLVYRAVTSANAITFYATEKPETALNVQIKAVRK